jgi:hypothetical protein
MWRILALALLVFAGCESSQAMKQPVKLPNADFLLDNSAGFFANSQDDGKVLPKS